MKGIIIVIIMILVGWYLIKNRKKGKKIKEEIIEKGFDTSYVCQKYSDKSFEHASDKSTNENITLYIKNGSQSIGYFDLLMTTIANPGYYISYGDTDLWKEAYIEIGENGSVISVTKR